MSSVRAAATFDIEDHANDTSPLQFNLKSVVLIGVLSMFGSTRQHKAKRFLHSLYGICKFSPLCCFAVMIGIKMYRLCSGERAYLTTTWKTQVGGISASVSVICHWTLCHTSSEHRDPAAYHWDPVSLGFLTWFSWYVVAFALILTSLQLLVVFRASRMQWYSCFMAMWVPLCHIYMASCTILFAMSCEHFRTRFRLVMEDIGCAPVGKFKKYVRYSEAVESARASWEPYLSVSAFAILLCWMLFAKELLSGDWSDETVVSLRFAMLLLISTAVINNLVTMLLPLALLNGDVNAMAAKLYKACEANALMTDEAFDCEMGFLITRITLTPPCFALFGSFMLSFQRLLGAVAGPFIGKLVAIYFAWLLEKP